MPRYKKIANKGFVIEPSDGALTSRDVSSHGLSAGANRAKKLRNRRAKRKANREALEEAG